MYVDCTIMHFMTVNATLRLAAYLAVSTSQEAMTFTVSALLNHIPHLVTASCGMVPLAL